MALYKNLIYIALFLISIDFISCLKLKKNFISFTDDEEITTITSDSESELLDAIEILNEKGGVIYIDTPVINLDENTIVIINGEDSGGIIGKRQSNGEYPRLNFNKISETLSGINIFGSNKFIEYIIIENVPDNGISIVGDLNIIDHVVSRYNFGSGFAVYGDFNTLNYCYSYRNCGSNINFIYADGFQIAGEINNVFKYCYAWENSDSGFNYIRELNSSELS